MTKRLFVRVAALSALVGLFALAWKSHQLSGARGVAASESTAKSVASNDAPLPAYGASTSPADAQRIRQLTAELQAKDRVIAALAKERPAASDSLSPKERALEEAARVYEERLIASGTDTPDARRNDRTVRKLMDELLPPGTKADLVCGSTMCRMATYGVPLKLSPHLEAIVDGAAKQLGSTRLLPKDDEVTVYFARSNDLLQITPTPANSPIPTGGTENKTFVVAADNPNNSSAKP